MRVLNRMLLLALFVCVAQSGLKAAQKNDNWASDVKESANLILSNSTRPDEVNRSFARLLDTAIKIAARDARLPAEFHNKLQTAAKAFAASPLSAESSTALNGAYKMINGGKDFTFPSGVQDISDASRIARQYIDRSINMLESGQSDQAVSSILVFMLLVSTPMTRQP
jgi:hypothetical protein